MDMNSALEELRRRRQRALRMAVSGPRVLEIAIGEKVTTEELGGWELHAEVTG